MASINDVAKKAGVGVSTVSKVLNNYANISKETREKVLAAAEELNYVPNAIASALSSKNSKRIAVIVFINNEHQAIDEISMQYLFGTFDRAKDYNLELVTIFSNVFSSMNKIEMIQYFKSLRVSAMIVYGLHKEEIDFTQLVEEKHFPTVLVDVPIENEITSYVMVDHQKAQYDIAKLMIRNNPTKVHKVLYLAGRRDGYVTDLRLQGVVDACSDMEVELNAQYSDFSEKLAIKLTKEHAIDADIIICASDLMAIGAINALKELEIFRPVCGYDGINLLGYLRFHILTVKQNFYNLAETAVEEVRRLMQNEVGRSVLLDYKITRINYEDVIL